MYVSMRKYHHKVTESKVIKGVIWLGAEFLVEIIFFKSVHENEKDELLGVIHYYVEEEVGRCLVQKCHPISVRNCQ